MLPIYHPTKCLQFFELVNHRQFRPLFMALMEAKDQEYYTDKQLDDICTYLKNFSFAYTLVMRNTSNNIDTKITGNHFIPLPVIFVALLLLR